jgi:hypothetical protein
MWVGEWKVGERAREVINLAIKKVSDQRMVSSGQVVKWVGCVATGGEMT